MPTKPKYQAISSSSVDGRRSQLITLVTSLLVGLSLYVFLFYSHYGETPSIEGNVVGYLMAIAVAAASTFAFLASHRWLDSILPWKKVFLARFLIGLAFGQGLPLIFTLIVFISYGTLLLGSEVWIADFNPELMKLLILLFFVAFIYESVYFVFYSYHQYAVVQAAAIAEKRKQKTLQFDALKSQLSPHFLFNSLNTISSLVYKDRVAAEEFVRRLAVTYQYVIETDNKMLVSLENEVEFIRSYYHLLRVRFEDALNIDINVPEHLMNSAIPPLTLQILIENAVKHNTVDKDHPLEIAIRGEETNYLVISNTKGESPANVSSFKVGLDNIKRRYAFHTARDIRIEDDADYVVHLPIIDQLELQRA